MGFLNDNIAALVRLATKRAALDTGDPEGYAPLLEAMAKCPEPALPGQTLAVAGAFLSCLKSRGAIVVGEMGVGKTNVAAYLTRMVQEFLQRRKDPARILDDPAAAKAAARHRRALRNRGAKILFLLAKGGHEEKMRRTFEKVLGDVETVMLDNSERSLRLALEDPPAGATRVFFASRDTIKGMYPLRLLERCPACLHDPYRAWEEENPNARRLPPDFPKCPNCGASLEAPAAKLLCEGSPVFSKARAVRGGVRKVPLLRRMRKRLRGKMAFDMVIVDEVHNMSGRNTLQSRLLMDARAVTPMLVGMTGTLSRGYASSVYNILWAIATEQMRKLGYEGEGGVRAFIEDFGALIGQFEERSQGYRYKEAPLVSPALYSLLLSPVSVYLNMEDLNVPMPAYEEYVRIVDPTMPDGMDVAKAAKEAAADGVRRIVEIRKRLKIPDYAVTYRQAAIQFALYAPDNPSREYILRVAVKKRYLKANPKLEEYMDETGRMPLGRVAPFLPEGVVTPKERELFNILEKEFEEGRACAIYVYFTETTGIADRLIERLQKRFPDKRFGALPRGIPSAKVDAWLAKNLFDACVIPYTRVAEGTELVQYPSLIFYQFDYEAVKIRQARRRAWRAVTQRRDCRVYYLAYRGMQADALHLVMKKIAAATTAEGGVVKEDEMAAGALDGNELRLLNRLVEDAEEAVEKDYPTARIPTGRKRPWTRWESFYLDQVRRHNPAALRHIDPDLWEEAGRPEKAPPALPEEPVIVPAAPVEVSAQTAPYDEETLSLFARPGRALVRKGRKIREIPVEKAKEAGDAIVGFQPALF